MNPTHTHQPTNVGGPEVGGLRLTYRKREAAAALGISERTLHDLLATREIPSFKLNRAVLIPVEGIRAYIQRQTGKGGPSA